MINSNMSYFKRNCRVYIVDLSTLEVKINIPIDSASRVLLSRCGKYAFVYKSGGWYLLF